MNVNAQPVQPGMLTAVELHQAARRALKRRNAQGRAAWRQPAWERRARGRKVEGAVRSAIAARELELLAEALEAIDRRRSHSLTPLKDMVLGRRSTAPLATLADVDVDAREAAHERAVAHVMAEVGSWFTPTPAATDGPALAVAV